MRHNRLFNLTLTAAALLLIAGCGGTSESDLVGTWKQSAKIELDAGDPVAERIAAKFQKRLDWEIELRADGTCTLTKSGTETECQWELNGQNVKITDKDGRNADIYQVSEDGTQLTPNGGDAAYFFTKSG